MIYSISAVLLLLLLSFWESGFLWLLGMILVLVFIGVYDIYQTKHTLRRNYPLFGRIRWVLEAMRPPIRQYFMESDIDGVPISRMHRGLVYRRAKKLQHSIPFGTKVDTYQPGYEWIGHSLKALDSTTFPEQFRVRIGSSQCRQPYDSSLLNISAMSFGALSQNAVLALGKGARSLSD